MHTSDNRISKAIALTGYTPYPYKSESIVNILRLLTQSSNNISSRDIYDLSVLYMGPPEGIEFIFAQDLIPSDPDVSDGEECFPFLALALKYYGETPFPWESFLRLLLRKRVGLHSPVPRFWNLERWNTWLAPTYPCSEYGTPLDELFSRTHTPFEGEAAAERWLQLLSSEGYDVKAYLELEEALHAEQMQLTYPALCM